MLYDILYVYMFWVDNLKKKELACFCMNNREK